MRLPFRYLSGRAEKCQILLISSELLQVWFVPYRFSLTTVLNHCQNPPTISNPGPFCCISNSPEGLCWKSENVVSFEMEMHLKRYSYEEMV